MASAAVAFNASALSPAIETPAISRLKLVAPAQSALPSDEDLFDHAAKGDREALGKLIGRYEDFLFGLLVRLAGGDEHRAEDFFQDAFLNAMRAAASFDTKKAFKPWITAIAVNLVRDDARKRKVRSEVGLDTSGPDDERERIDPVASNEDPGSAAERRDEEEKVHRALNRLTDLEREVVLLHFFNGMTLQETASALSAPLGTIKSRLHAALQRLNGMLSRA